MPNLTLPSRVAVSSNGGVCLGDSIVCDGFVYGRPYRIQTHIHEDHMHGFEESKGFQEILLSPATKRLLEAEFNADLNFRTNIRAIPLGVPHALGEISLRLLPANHMLGAVQVEVVLPDGARVGYSGDIGWPIDNVIRVDELVIDSTNGSPERSIRKYRQVDAEGALVEVVVERLRFGNVHLQAHRGTLHRALQVLAPATGNVFVASDHRLREIQVFREFAYAMPTVFSRSSCEGQRALANGRCVVLYSKGDPKPKDYSLGDSTVMLSAYMVNGHEPLVKYSESSYRVALSDHADYGEIIQYVRATGARKVLVDGARGGHGLELALALKNELGVDAAECVSYPTREWGR